MEDIPVDHVGAKSEGERAIEAASESLTDRQSVGSVEADGSAEPVLLIPESLTPLPAVDAAMPLLEHFAVVVGRRRARYKIALLKTLQGDGSGRWKIRRLQEIVHWLEPMSVTDLVGELRAVGVLSYEPVSALYRMTANARVVTALLDALTIPEVHPRSLIKFLNKAMALAQAGGAGDDVILRQFNSAVAVLKGDWEDLNRLLGDFSDEALLEAAELVRIHVDDMRELLDEHQAFFVARQEHTLFLSVDQEALDLIARLGQLAAEVVEALSGRADQRMRAGLRFDRTDVREFLASKPTESLAQLLAGLVAPPPFVVAISPGLAFGALAEASQRVINRPPTLPAPVTPTRERPVRRPDAAEHMRTELTELKGATSVAELTVRETWAESVGRHSAVVDAYSRWSDLPSLAHEPGCEEFAEGEVWRVSRTTVEAGP